MKTLVVGPDWSMDALDLVESLAVGPDWVKTLVVGPDWSMGVNLARDRSRS